MMDIPRIALTPGEPAGIGPDLAIMLSQKAFDADIVAICDPELLRERARRLGLAFTPVAFDPESPPAAQRAGRLHVAAVDLAAPVQPGRLNPDNGRYVLDTLTRAARWCETGVCAAMVTGPVQKSVINDAGIPFTGHTEFLAQLTGAGEPVMMLATPGLRVALATTHLPLRDVAAHITAPRLNRTLDILTLDLRRLMGIERPRIYVTGLNPHAGEGGYLGREEIDVIAPVLEAQRTRGVDLIGPLPADTLFTPKYLQHADAVLAMYHDQGLPVIKHMGFGQTVNVTLGLPIVRTSVDHGTALDLAGSGNADASSLEAALEMAIEIAHNVRRARPV